MSIAGFRILFTVWTLGELQPRQLARLAGVSRAAISGALKTLERDGLVEAPPRRPRRTTRQRAPHPARATTVETAYIEQNRRERLLFESLDHDTSSRRSPR
ncbi:MAG: MarR family transcriptional regulator [Acidimicrobiales bacterium]